MTDSQSSKEERVIGYTVERHDKTWGGWRRVPTSFTNDAPYLVKTRRTALRRCVALIEQGGSYRVRPVLSTEHSDESACPASC